MLCGQAEGDRFRRALADRARREVVRPRTEWMIDGAMSTLGAMNGAVTHASVLDRADGDGLAFAELGPLAGMFG